MELPNRQQWERTFAARFARLNARHRRELLNLAGNPPDPALVPEAFWDRVQREEAEEAALLLYLIFLASAELHGLDESTAQLEAGLYAAERSRLLADQLRQTSVERFERVAQRLREIAIQRAAEQEMRLVPLSVQEIDQELATIFGDQRAQQIAINETTAAQFQGGERAVELTVGKNENDTWFTVEDKRVCPICRPLHGRKRPDWERFFPDGPPSPHSGCRCRIEYAAEKLTPELVGAG